MENGTCVFVCVRVFENPKTMTHNANDFDCCWMTVLLVERSDDDDDDDDGNFSFCFCYCFHFI